MAAPLDQQPLAPAPGRKGLFFGMLQVALSSFGGGMSAWSQRIVVEQRRWMSNESFITGLTVARLLSLIHISEPTRLLSISYAVFCLKKKKK